MADITRTLKPGERMTVRVKSPTGTYKSLPLVEVKPGDRVIVSQAGTTPTPTPTSGFVTRTGTSLMLNGAPYRFTGFNIYNANSRWNCWYPMVGGGLDRALTDIGGGGVFRAWFFQSLATTNGARDWAAFDATLATAKTHNVRVMVTLTDHWGACEGTGQKGEAWYTTGYKTTVYSGDRATYREFVREIVTRYRDNPIIMMWQIVNEAESKTSSGACSSVSVLKNFAADIGGLIKSIDPNHLVSFGTLGGQQCGIAGDAYREIHTSPFIDVCEYHDYWSVDALHGELQGRIDQSKALSKPIFIGEMGIKISDAGGSTATRAARFGAKFGAQFGAGVAGILLWVWRNGDQGSAVDHDIGPGDPALLHVRTGPL